MFFLFWFLDHSQLHTVVWQRELRWGPSEQSGHQHIGQWERVVRLAHGKTPAVQNVWVHMWPRVTACASFFQDKTPRRTVISKRGLLTWSSEDMDSLTEDIEQASTPKKKRLCRMNSQDGMTSENGDGQERTRSLGFFWSRLDPQ